MNSFYNPPIPDPLQVMEERSTVSFFYQAHPEFPDNVNRPNSSPAPRKQDNLSGVIEVKPIGRFLLPPLKSTKNQLNY